MKSRNLFSYTIFFLIAVLFLANSNDLHAQRKIKRKPYKKVVHVSPPKGSKKIVHHKVNYHFADGVFYKLKKDKYVVAKSPIGIRVSVVPSRAKIVHVGGVKYHYYYGTYYRYLPEYEVYEVVENPNTVKTVFDEVLFVDGQKMEGYYRGGTSSLIQFEVQSEILEIPIEDIIKITFAPTIE